MSKLSPYFDKEKIFNILDQAFYYHQQKNNICFIIDDDQLFFELTRHHLLDKLNKKEQQLSGFSQELEKYRPFSNVKNNLYFLCYFPLTTYKLLDLIFTQKYYDLFAKKIKIHPFLDISEKKFFYSIYQSPRRSQPHLAALRAEPLCIQHHQDFSKQLENLFYQYPEVIKEYLIKHHNQQTSQQIEQSLPSSTKKLSQKI